MKILVDMNLSPRWVNQRRHCASVLQHVATWQVPVWGGELDAIGVFAAQSGNYYELMVGAI